MNLNSYTTLICVLLSIQSNAQVDSLLSVLKSTSDNAYNFATNSLNYGLKANEEEENFNHIYKLLSEISALQGRYNIAYEYQLQYQNIQDSMLNNEREKYLMKYYTAFQVDEKEAENEILKDK